jgi:hypothetical protein
MNMHLTLLLPLRRALTCLTVAATAALAIPTEAQAAPHGSKPLTVTGYQYYENQSFPNPGDPSILEVRTQGQGGLSHLGAMRSWSDDQQGNLVTGALTATYTFEDTAGDQLRLSAIGSSQLTPDFRITFSGTLTVEGGTGKFAQAAGSLAFDGWARTTDFSTGVGIGFLTFDGVITGTDIQPQKPFTYLDVGTGTIINNTDFVYEGGGVSTRIGRFQNHSASYPGPLNSAFVGIIDGRFVLTSIYDTTWTTPNGDTLLMKGFQMIHFELLTFPGGGIAPDFSKPSTTYPYYTIVGGTGRFANAQGVIIGRGGFTPTSPTTVHSEIRGAGWLSR